MKNYIHIFLTVICIFLGTNSTFANTNCAIDHKNELVEALVADPLLTEVTEIGFEMFLVQLMATNQPSTIAGPQTVASARGYDSEAAFNMHIGEMRTAKEKLFTKYPGLISLGVAEQVEIIEQAIFEKSAMGPSFHKCWNQYYPGYLICMGIDGTGAAAAFFTWCFRAVVAGVIALIIGSAGLDLPLAIAEVAEGAEACGTLAYGTGVLAGVGIIYGCSSSLIQNIVGCRRG